MNFLRRAAPRRRPRTSEVRDQTSGGNSEPFLEANFRRIKMKNKNAPKCAQWVWGIDWRQRIFLFAPKPILGPVWGPFWPESAEGAKFRGEKMPKSGTLGNRPRGHPMALPWPVVASTVLLGTQRATRVGGWSVGVRARGLSHPLLAGWGGLALNLAQKSQNYIQ